VRAKQTGVYVFKNLEGLYKVGYTDDLERRKRHLEKALGQPLELAIFAESAFGFVVETILHKKFQDKWDHGEWYRLGQDDLSFIQELADGGDITSFFWACKVLMDDYIRDHPDEYAEVVKWAEGQAARVDEAHAKPPTT